jgi:hypothetical protein
METDSSVNAMKFAVELLLVLVYYFIMNIK